MFYFTVAAGALRNPDRTRSRRSYARLFSGVEARISSFNQRLGGLTRMPMCNADREGDMPEVFTSRRLITSREVMALRKFSATVLASRRFVFGRMTANSSPA
jgi:hypothetical protein